MAADHDSLSRRFRVGCKDNDVFLSFRGVDTRHSLISHLYLALLMKGIKTFIDNGLRRGEYVTELFSKIKSSRICIVVFSINYAGSVWCLNELVQMIQDKEIVVLPIFYKVSPSDVRHQMGYVGNHFVSNEKIRNSGSELIGMWRNALTKLGNISGWEVKHQITDEAEIIQHVVYKVSRILESLAAYNNYNRRIHLQPQTVNPTNTLGNTPAPYWPPLRTHVDQRGTLEKQCYSRFFGEASKLNKPSTAPLRETQLIHELTSCAKIYRLPDRIKAPATNKCYSAIGSSSQNSKSQMTESQTTVQVLRSGSSRELTAPSIKTGVSSIGSSSQSYESHHQMTESQIRQMLLSCELTDPSRKINEVSSNGSSSQRSESSQMTESLTTSRQPEKFIKIRLRVEADVIMYVPIRKGVLEKKKVSKNKK